MKQEDQFRHLVLNALWVLILCAFSKHGWARKQATNFQSGAIRYGDQFGTQGEDAAKCRRDVTYGGVLD